MAAKKQAPPLTQQEFLRDAIAKLGMTNIQFAQRIRVPIKTFNKWLAPANTSDFRNMPDVVWSYVRDILEWTEKNP